MVFAFLLFSLTFLKKTEQRYKKKFPTENKNDQDNAKSKRRIITYTYMRLNT